MPISLTNRQRIVKIDRRWIVSKARRLLELLNCPTDELSVLLVDDGEMSRLNQHYRGDGRPTDVLAFSMREGKFRELSAGLLGDVVISVETAKHRLRPDSPSKGKPGGETLQPEVRKGDPLGQEVLRLLIHGTLHLVGHDHQTPGQLRKMRAEERRLLKPLWPEGPIHMNAEGTA